jgi:hypothetical protein
VEGGVKIVEVFRVKNHDFTPKNIIFFPILGGGGGGPKIGKNMIFWRKIVIFHTKYLNNFRASLGN